MFRALWPAFRLWFVLTVLTGVLYPAVVTVLAHTLFAHQAGGSLIEAHGVIVGSEHLGQSFRDPVHIKPPECPAQTHRSSPAPARHLQSPAHQSGRCLAP